MELALELAMAEACTRSMGLGAGLAAATANAAANSILLARVGVGPARVVLAAACVSTAHQPAITWPVVNQRRTIY